MIPCNPWWHPDCANYPYQILQVCWACSMAPWLTQTSTTSQALLGGTKPLSSTNRRQRSLDLESGGAMPALRHLAEVALLMVFANMWHSVWPQMMIIYDNMWEQDGPGHCAGKCRCGTSEKWCFFPAQGSKSFVGQNSWGFLRCK